MTVAHTDMNIAQIPGLDVHPAQIAELQRLAEVKKAEAAAGITAPAASTTNADGTTKPANIMPDPTREALKKLALALRKAGGLGDAPPPPAPASTPPSLLPGQKPAQPGPAAPAPSKQGMLDPAADRRAATLVPASARPSAAPPTPAVTAAAKSKEVPHHGVP